MSSGIGLFGTGSSGGVVTEILSLGAMDNFLIKGAQCTFWRFRYCRHTNFAMDAVGQPFNVTPAFGGHSNLILQRVGDLLYYMYAVIELPGIYACRKGGRSYCDDDYCGYGSNQFPAHNGRVGCAKADRDAFRRYARDHENVDVNDPCAEKIGKAAWLKNNYGSCYNPDVEGTPSSCGSVPDDKPWCHYANAIGQLLIKRAVLVVGGHQSDTLYSDFLYMWEELSGKAGKRLREMIGKRKSRKALIRDARHTQRFYVPLPWYFTLTSGNALPLCTLQFHGVHVHIEWEKIDNCVVVSDKDVEVRKCSDNTRLVNSDLKAWLDTTFIYLDIEERNRFSLANFDQLMTQVQFKDHHTTQQTVQIPITFSHPTIELIWAVRRRCVQTRNNWFNYSGIDGRDPVEEVSLTLNNMQRFSGREGRYYRLVQPYQHHSSIPKAHVYSYSFALFPEEPQPSGSLNLSRIDHVAMNFILQEGVAKDGVTILIFARSWNIMRFTEGGGGPLFN